MKFLQKLGKALMLPVAVLPICGILMGIGYFLCPATMQGGDIEGVRNLIGLFLVKAGGALIDNMAILFVIGVGVGMSEKNDGTGGIAALASWLMMTTLLSTDFVTTIMPSIADSATKTLAFDKIANPFIGILAGVIGSLCYNRFKDTKLPDWLSFFSGKRCVAIVSGVVSIIASVVLLFVWPVIFGALVALGEAIVSLDAVGAGIYAFFNRLLIPFGLHHVFYLPYLMGERSPHNDPKARATFIGMSMDTTRKDMTQAVLEGVAFGLRDSLEVARRLGIKIERTRICGGGAKSPLWKKMIANIMNLKVDVVESEEGPALGGAMLAAVGCGEYPDVETAAAKIVKVVDTVEPDEELTAKYEERYQQFRKIYPTVKCLYEK